MLWIVSWDCVNSLKKVQSKTTLPSIALVCEVPANDTDVVFVLGPERRRCVYPLSPSACSSIHSAISLLTNDVWAPVSNKVAAENEGLSPTVTSQHILYYCTYYSVSFTCTVQYILHTVHTVHVPCFPVSLFPMLRFHLQHLFTTLVHTLSCIHIQVFT